MRSLAYLHRIRSDGLGLYLLDQSMGTGITQDARHQMLMDQLAAIDDPAKREQAKQDYEVLFSLNPQTFPAVNINASTAGGTKATDTTSSLYEFQMNEFSKLDHIEVNECTALHIKEIYIDSETERQRDRERGRGG